MSPQAVVLSLVVHRITVSKESVKLLHRTVAGISYTVVLKQIKRFSFDTQNSSSLVPKNIPKGQPTHVTIDNTDRRQQNLTGLAITHHTNVSIYVPKIQSLPDTDNCLENETINTYLVMRCDYEEYKIGKPPEPPLVTEYKGVHRDLIDKHLQTDCATSITATFTSKKGSPSYPRSGSWTVFNTQISDVANYKSETGFLPFIPQPPKDNVCKCYLDFLLDVKNHQNLNYIFCHSDQDVFYR